VSTEKFLAYLRTEGFELQVADGKLRINAPKGALTPALRDELLARKAELLELLRSMPGNGQPAYAQPAMPRLVPLSRQESVPLSYTQERLWFLDQFQPGNPANNIPVMVRLTGQLDVAALERTFTTIVQRHESLRAGYTLVEGQPVQAIAGGTTILLPVTDLGSLPAAERESQLQQLAAEIALAPFDLAGGALLRLALFRLAEAEHILVLVTHHFAADGWSMSVLFQEMVLVYGAFVNGQPAPLRPLSIQFADFAAWQRQCLKGEQLQRQLAYWKQQMAGAPAILELPTDFPRPPVQTSRGAKHFLAFPPHLTRALRHFSREQGVTLFTTMVALFQLLLYRYSGQDDLVIGTATSNRHQKEIEPLIGPFGNNLALRTNLAGNPTFHELLGRVREITLGAFAHQDVPFEKVVEALQPERTLGYNPLFQHLFILHNTGMPALRFAGVKASPLPFDAGTARFDLTLELYEGEDELTGWFEYNADLFAPETVSRLAGKLQLLAENVLAWPEQRITRLPLLTAAERQQVLHDWNDTRLDYPRGACLHELFEAQTARTPSATAVIFEGQALTFAELNQRANQLAHTLQELGAGPDTAVGVFLERSPEAIIAFLATLKAGGYYLPLDPAYPAARLAFMLQDSRPAVVLSRQSLAPQLPAPQARVLCLDSDWPLIATAAAGNPPNRVTPEHPAYLIYTSGSTGRPKGVLGLHRGAVNRFHWMWANYPFAEGEVCCQKTSLNFVDSVWETFGPLLQGIPLLVVSNQVAGDPGQLVSLLAQYDVSRLLVVPSFLRSLLDSQIDLQQTLPALRLWVTSGEALTVALLRQFRTALPHSRLLNLYGSSEVAADATCYELKAADVAACRIPIGRPIANTQIYILDRFLQPLPTGVSGELYVAGDGVAGGYLHRPGLTADRFIPDPFGARPGGRLYRTGDLARYLPDGTVEFMGRADYQVKVRGFRIEMGEIESVLAQHPGVDQALVTAHEEGAGGRRLVAYVVRVAAGDPATTGDLRRWLAEKLPDYMVPALFTFLDEMPLTPNGKVNRRALPVPDNVRPELEVAFAGPDDETGRAVAAVWQEVLGIDRVGIYDNFFDLGGHSLLMIQVHAKLQQQLRQSFSMIDLFKYPTIHLLSQFLSRSDEREPLFQVQEQIQKLELGAKRLKQQLQQRQRNFK
jgi:amino acid adenylation domain-containing protein